MNIGYIKHRVELEADAEFAKYKDYVNCGYDKMGYPIPDPTADEETAEAILEGYVVMREFIDRMKYAQKCSTFYKRLSKLEHELEEELFDYKYALRQELHETDVMLKAKTIKFEAIANLKRMLLTEDMTGKVVA